MSRDVRARPLGAEEFAPFGEALDASGGPDMIINQGRCRRFHDRAALDFGGGRAGISIFDGEPRALPLALEMVERHPLGSQAFVPMHANPWLVVVAPDERGAPGRPLAFLAAPGQGVNLRRGTWHGVLTPLRAPGLFAVIDRIAGDGEIAGANLEEHWFDEPWRIVD